MVFGLIRKDDTNFQTLDESCAFSCFDANEVSASTSGKEQELSGAQYFSGKNLLTTTSPSDSLDEDSDSNLLDELMPYLNNTKSLVRAPSMDKEIHGDSESAKNRTVLRAPSMDRTNSFIKYENGEGSESSESLDDLYIHENKEIVQLELPGIATVSATSVNNVQNSLENLPTYDDHEIHTSHQMDASIAFTTCFELTANESVTKLDPIMLSMGSLSIDMNELVSFEIVNIDTVQKIRQYFAQNQRDMHATEAATKQTSVDETKRRGRRRDAQNQSTVSPSRRDSATKSSELKSSTDSINGDRQSEPTERRRSNYSSPDQKIVQDEKGSNKEIEMKSTITPNDSTSVSKHRTNPDRRLPNKGTNNGNKCNTTEPGQIKRISDSSPNKSRPRPARSSNIVESQKSRISDDNVSANRIKPRRSNSMNTVESLRHSDIMSNSFTNENASSTFGDASGPADASRTNDHSNESEGQIIYDISSPVSSKKQASRFGNTGNKMIKFLSNRYLNQEKERPCLVKTESLAIVGCPHGLDSAIQDSKDSASAKEFNEFKGHLEDGTVPFTPRSQKRFLSWRTGGLKKSLTIGSSSRHLIEGELDVLEKETNTENHCVDTTNISRPVSEFTVQNETTFVTSMVRDPKEVVVLREESQVHGTLAHAHTRKNASKLHRDRSNHLSSSSEKNFQKEVKDSEPANRNDRKSQSPAKSSRVANKTPPKRSVARTSTTENQSSSANDDVDKVVVDSSDHSTAKHKHSDSSSTIQSTKFRENFKSDILLDSHTNSHSRDKSPLKRRSSMSRGLSQTVHVQSSPIKKGGKGSSTTVSRRQRLLASNLLDDGPSSLICYNNQALAQEVPKQLSEPTIDTEQESRQLSFDLDLNPTSGVVVGDARPPKNLSRSLHISSPTKRIGHNAELKVDANVDQSYKSKMQSKGSTAIVAETGIDSVDKKGENDSKPNISSRTRRTSCTEIKKGFAVEQMVDEPVVAIENVGRRRRNSLGMPMKAHN